MDIYEYEMDFDKASDICRIIERITGRAIYHGDTDYEFDEVIEQMKTDSVLIDEIISTGSFEGDYEACAEGSDLDADAPETRYDFAITILEGALCLATE